MFKQGWARPHLKCRCSRHSGGSPGSLSRSFNRYATFSRVSAFLPGLASIRPEALTSGSSSAVETVPGITPEISATGVEALKAVYSSAFRLIYLVGMAFGLLACLGVRFATGVDEKLTKQVAVQLDRPHLVGHGKSEAKVLEQKESG